MIYVGYALGYLVICSVIGMVAGGNDDKNH